MSLKLERMNFLENTKTILELDQEPVSKQRDLAICASYLQEDKLAFRNRIKKQVLECLERYPEIEVRRVLEDFQLEDPRGTHSRLEYLVLVDKSSEIAPVLISRYHVKFVWNSLLNRFEEQRPKEFDLESLKVKEAVSSSGLWQKCDAFFKLSASYKDEFVEESVDDAYKDKAVEIMLLNCVLGIFLSIVILAGLLYFNG